MNKMIRKIINECHIDGLLWISREVIIRLLWSCMISKQEFYYLILRTHMVSCSRQFCKINLKNIFTCKANFNTIYNVDKVLGSNKTPEVIWKD